MHSDLAPLDSLVKSSGNMSTFQLPGHPKKQKGWDVQWEIEDDVALLKGIYRYGLGSWESIKMDPEYGLAEKVGFSDCSINVNSVCEIPLRRWCRLSYGYFLRRLFIKYFTNQASKDNAL